MNTGALTRRLTLRLPRLNHLRKQHVAPGWAWALRDVRRIDRLMLVDGTIKLTIGGGP